MIAVTIIKDKKKYKKIESKGHAGFSEFGTDIVCAAASVLIINTLNSISEFTQTRMEVDSEKSGYLKAVFPDGTDGRSRLLLDSMVLGLSQIEKQYGKKYLSVDIQEVKKC